MTIVALLGRPYGDEAAKMLFRGRPHERIEAGADRAWLGSSGDAHCTRFVDRNLVVVNESDGGSNASNIADAYRRDGLDFIRALQPPFAFVLFDAIQKRLIATSDITSRAPFAYWTGPDSVVVSSSVLSLLSHPSVDRALDDDYLAHLITGFCSADPGTTALRDIKRLTAGIALVADNRGVNFVQVDRLTPRTLPTRDRATWINGFWEEVDAALTRTNEADNRACLSLSGGLDSSALVSAMVRRATRRTPVGSFSIVAPGRPFDESEAIQVLEHAYHAGLENRRLDCSDAVELSPLDGLPLFDDPVLTPLALLPARLRLWREAQRAGFSTVIDGEGGDEIFGCLCGPREALRRHEWQSAWGYLNSKRGERRAIFLRGFVLPILPRRLQRRWAHHRASGSERLPSYLSDRARSHPMIEFATQQFYEAQIDLDFAHEVLRWLSAPAIVGGFATQRTLASALGVSLESPLLHRRVIELALGIPTEWMLTSEYRAFLPDATSGRVPDAVRMRAKDIRLPSILLREIVSSASTRQFLHDERVHERLGAWIRFERVDGLLDAIGSGYDVDDNVFWEQIAGIVAFGYWYRRASTEYGVR